MRALAAMLCALALVAAGCGGGGDDKEEYVDRYRPLGDRLVTISQQIDRSLAGAGGAASLGVRFDLKIAQLETVNRNIEELDTPGELRDESGELTGSVRRTVATLRRISAAVREGKDATPAAVELAARAQAVNRARDRLSRAAGID